MYYIVQENVFRDIHYDYLIQALDRLGLAYEIVKLRSSDFLEFETKRKDVFCFGSIKLARTAHHNVWFPGSLMNDNHDYPVYAAQWKEHMLNSDSLIQKVEDPFHFNRVAYFIRPTKDSKIFTGKLFDELAWSEMKKMLMAKGKGQDYIQIARPKIIFQEIRCWIVNAQVVSASTYKIGNQVRYQHYFDEDGLDFARKMAACYQPAAAFVLDICYSEQGWKIVEVNCINSAGFYACNLQKLLMALENYYNPLVEEYEK